MAGELVAYGPGAHMVHDLLQSDRRYFEWAASVEDLGGAYVSWMTGIEGLASGSVVQVTDAARIAGGDADRWLARVEERLAGLGCPQARLYEQRPDPLLAPALFRRGYRPRTELGLVHAGLPARAPAGITLRSVTTEDDWATKLAMHADCPMAPDGHASVASLWVEMERRKARAGDLQPLLIMEDGDVCGAVGFIECSWLLRIKNLVVHPAHRRRSVATRAVRALCAMAASMGKSATGVFAVPDSAGHRVYEDCGFDVVTRQIEWQKVGLDAARTPAATVGLGPDGNAHRAY